jgi:hypothetical protein
MRDDQVKQAFIAMTSIMRSHKFELPEFREMIARLAKSFITKIDGSEVCINQENKVSIMLQQSAVRAEDQV